MLDHAELVRHYGPWERADEDIRPVLAQDSTGTVRLHHVQRRKVFEYWRDEDGQKWCRWHYEYAATAV